VAHLRTAVVALALVFAAGERDAGAYELRGYEWPGDEITYWVAAPEYRDELAYGAAAWNRAKVGIVFRVAESRRKAQVLVTRGTLDCGGSAWAGYYGPDVQTRVTLDTGCPDRRLTALVATHELGHVLGLGHEPKVCALLNPTADLSGTPSRCSPRPLRVWYLSPLRRDDIRGARARYRDDEK
jgi:hypothetical protein